jgi:hypothetical protein
MDGAQVNGDFSPKQVGVRSGVVKVKSKAALVSAYSIFSVFLRIRPV